LLKIQSSIKLGELLQLDDLAVAESLAKGILGLVDLDQGLSKLQLFLGLLSRLLISDNLLEKSSLGKKQFWSIWAEFLNFGQNDLG
jgi:hypothetical protein